MFLVGRASRTGPHPVLVLDLVQRIDIEQHVPVRIALPRVIGSVGPTPEAADMAGILPEIVHNAVLDGWQGNAVVGVQHLQDGIVIGFVLRIRFQRGERPRVLLLDPDERLCAMNIGQPQPGIGRVRGKVRISRGGGETDQHRRKCHALHNVSQFHGLSSYGWIGSNCAKSARLSPQATRKNRFTFQRRRSSPSRAPGRRRS